MKRGEKYQETNHRHLMAHEWLDTIQKLYPNEQPPGKWPIRKWLQFANELSEINTEKQQDFDSELCSRMFKVVIKQ